MCPVWSGATVPLNVTACPAWTVRRRDFGGEHVLHALVQHAPQTSARPAAALTRYSVLFTGDCAGKL